MEELNLTLVESYSSRSSDTPGLHRKSKNVVAWDNELAKLNSIYSWSARSSGLFSSRSLDQSPKKPSAECSFKESYICNQAGFNWYLTRVQINMMAQLKVIQNDKAKGKLLVETHGATEDLQHLLIFNQTIHSAMANAAPIRRCLLQWSTSLWLEGTHIQII